MIDDIEKEELVSGHEFDKALEEFLSSHSDSDVVKTSETMICYREGETEYEMPEGILPAAYTFGSAELNLDGTDVLDEATHFKTSLHKYRSDAFFYLMFDQIEKAAFCNGELAQVFLYKKGRSKALIQESYEPNESGIYLDMSDLLGGLRPGDYFILLNNLAPVPSDTRFEQIGNNYRFCFSLLPDGGKVSHPRIRSMEVEREAGESVGMSGKLMLSLSISRALNMHDEFMAYCYDNSYCLMDKISVTKRNGSPAKRKIDFVFDSPFMWMPDRYLCLIAHNGEPFYKVSFELDYNGKAVCYGENIQKNLPDYALMNYLEVRKEYLSSWSMLRRVMGFASLKHKVMGCFQAQVFDCLREDNGLFPITRNMNYVFIGEERAETQQVLDHFAYLLCQPKDFHYLDIEYLAEPKNAAELCGEMPDALDKCKEGIVCLTRIAPLLGGNGRAIYRFLKRKLDEGYCTFFIRATEAEAVQLFDIYPALRASFPKSNRIELGCYTPSDVAHTIQKSLENQQLYFSPKAERYLADLIMTLYRKGELNQWGQEEAERFLQESVFPYFQQRVLNLANVDEAERQTVYATIEPEDIRYETAEKDGLSYGQCMKELEAMVGLVDIKRHLAETFNHVRFNQLRKQIGLPNKEAGINHCVFIGSPGTGKTTVAKMMGKIYHAMGLLSKGEVIVTERSRIVGQYIGETEKNMQAILSQAQGNVLFIDEAYTLTADRDGKKDFGYRAIECLLTVLAQPKQDMIVILAGYEQEMLQMLDTNPGLKGRFPHVFRFADYSADELMQIARQLLAKGNYVLEGEAAEYLYSTICETVNVKGKNFSNARWIEQYVCHGIFPAMANRVLSHELPIDWETCRLIKKEDVESAYVRFKSISQSPVSRIGFRI